MHITFLRTTLHNNKTAIYNIYNMRERERETDVKYGHQYLELLDSSTRIFHRNRQSF